MSLTEQCPYCRRWSAGNKPCAVATCVACGTPQCMGNGGARGTCAVCLHGHLDGWSWGLNGRPKCGYAKCSNLAVYVNVPRVGNCCRECAPRVKVKFLGKTTTLAENIEKYIQERRKAHERTT